jgi:methionyl-tRNA formyltransferase
MRIVIHGQQAFGKAVLERLIGGEDEVCAVFCPPDKEGRPADPLKTCALEQGLPVHQLQSWKTEAAFELLAAQEADLCLMAYVTQIVPSRCLDLPAKGSIQYHPSLLPRHRGPSAINWAVIAGETRTGLSVFWPDDGLDTGPILLQREVPIGPDDTVGSLYFDHLFPMGVDAMMEALEMVRDGTAPRIPQDEAEATYEGWCRPENAEVDWSETADRVHDLIRGTDPQPGAWTTQDGVRLTLFGSRRVEAAGRPGEILALADGAMTVAAARGGISIARVRPEGGREKIPAAAYAARAGLEPGSILGEPGLTEARASSVGAARVARGHPRP